MKHRITALTIGLLFALFLFTLPAKAGGWVVFTLEELPAQFIAGEPQTIEISVRQHGHVLTSAFGIPTVYGTHAETGERLKVVAEPTSHTGYFTAEIVFPQGGTWDWSIGLYDDRAYAQTMPRLEVETSALSPNSQPQTSFSAPLAMGVMGLVVVVGSGVVFLNTRTRWVLAVAMAGLLLTVIGLAGMVQPPAAAASAAPVQPLAQEEIGKALFMAKGCVVCHSHAEAQKTGFQTNIGPNLTDTQLPTEYIQTWLKDPAEIKPETLMPNLDLKAYEIEALAAFLTANP